MKGEGRRKGRRARWTGRIWKKAGK